MNKTLNKEGFALRRKKIPMRMCVGCREMKSKIELIRVVKSPEGDISIDDKRGKSLGEEPIYAETYLYGESQEK